MPLEYLINGIARAWSRHERGLGFLCLVPGSDLMRLRHLLDREAGYEMQRRLFQESGSLRTVVQELARQWRTDVFASGGVDVD